MTEHLFSLLVFSFCGGRGGSLFISYSSLAMFPVLLEWGPRWGGTAGATGVCHRVTLPCVPDGSFHGSISLEIPVPLLGTASHNSGTYSPTLQPESGLPPETVLRQGPLIRAQAIWSADVASTFPLSRPVTGRPIDVISILGWEPHSAAPCPLAVGTRSRA